LSDDRDFGKDEQQPMPKPAPPQKRLAAFLLDYLVILGYLLALYGISLGVRSVSGIELAGRPNPLVMDLIAFSLAVLPTLLYFALQESGGAQATWGKRKVSIRVVTLNGEKLSPGQALVRSTLKLVPWQLAHTSLFHIPGWPISPEAPGPLVIVGLVTAQVLVLAYILSLLLAPMHRTPYDWASGAIVIASENRRGDG
jgi:uncharacterized RDD family membrane protein YckC